MAFLQTKYTYGKQIKPGLFAGMRPNFHFLTFGFRWCDKSAQVFLDVFLRPTRSEWA